MRIGLLRLLLLCLVLSGSAASSAYGQGRYWHRWQYEVDGLDFTAGRQPAVYGAPYTGISGAVQIADSMGQASEFFMGDTRGLGIHDRNGTLLPGGQLLPVGTAIDGLIVPWPRHPEEYLYLYLVRPLTNSPLELRYCVLDRRLRGRLGDVSLRGFSPFQPDSVTPRLATNARAGFALVQHANGRDYWVVTMENTALAAYLISPRGVAAQPVRVPLLTPQPTAPISAIFEVNSRILASSRGNVLLVERYGSAPGQKYRLERHSFNQNTGQIGVGSLLYLTPDVVGADPFTGFTPSPTGRWAYATQFRANEGRLAQFDLTAPDSAAFRRSLRVVHQEQWAPGGASWGGLPPLRTGPNGKMYLLNPNYIDVINCPDAPAAQCGFQRNAIRLLNGGSLLYYNDHIPATFFQLPGFTFQNAPLNNLCLGQPLQLALPNAQYLDSARWQFGDGGRQGGLGPLSHQYAQPGTYRVRVQVWYNGCATDTSSQVVRVQPQPSVALPATAVLCPGTPLTLQPQVGAGVTAYQWNTGASTAALPVAQAGTYTLTVRTAAGCTATATTTVRAAAVPALAGLPSDTVLCFGSELRLRAPTTGISTVRWPDGRTGPSYLVGAAGPVVVQLTTTEGCQLTRVVQVQAAECPDRLLLPNIITPNGDGRNDAFQVVGLEPGAWRLEVYSRWGRLVYEQASYRSGQWQAEGQSAGVYYYRLSRGSQQYQGWVEVAR
jgi:gliding motility-associated-like protein